ncbi:DUF2807 domain-containing protein [Phenylobacterium sp. LjRoot225]|uniref:GIN domain-containing protein n=1 Tax=Phenylobacterium sp. LjRoot225 TaxID=3342285 RepID=UPI003ED0231D
MIRALVIIAVGGFLMSLACISAAVAIGGPEAIARSAWSWDWDWKDRSHGWRHMREASGPQTQRDFPWGGGDRLEVNAPATIDYVQAAGPAKLTIKGPAAALDRVRVEGGRISLTGAMRWSDLQITLTAPDVTRFELNGANSLNITGYKHDQLTLSASGHAEIRAQGETKSVKLSVSGAGDADLAQLKTAGADIDISGAGAATVGPTDWARVEISGMGDVNLLTRPKTLESHVSGAGHIRQPGQDSVTAGDDDDDDRGPERTT